MTIKRLNSTILTIAVAGSFLIAFGAGKTMWDLHEAAMKTGEASEDHRLVESFVEDTEALSTAMSVLSEISDPGVTQVHRAFAPLIHHCQEKLNQVKASSRFGNTDYVRQVDKTFLAMLETGTVLRQHRAAGESSKDEFKAHCGLYKKLKGHVDDLHHYAFLVAAEERRVLQHKEVTAKYVIGAFACSFFTFIFLISRWATKSVVLPLKSLAEKAERSADTGEYFALEENGPQEVKSLTRAIRTFANSMERKVQEVQLAEQRAKQEKNFSERLIDSSEDGIFAFDRECRYTVWNPGMERMSGVSRDKVIGRCAFDLFPFLKQMGQDRYFHEALSGKPVVVAESPYLVPETHKGGYYAGHFAPLLDESGTVTGGLAIIRDVTERRVAEQTLKESEALYRSLFENASIGIGIADPEGNLLAFNDAILAPGAYSREDILAMKNVAKLYYESAAREEVLRLVKQHGCVRHYEVQFRRKDGSPYDTLLSLTPVRIAGKNCLQAIVEDITERKRATQQLRLTQFSMDHASIPVLWLSDKGRILYVNSVASKGLGYPAEELLAMTVHDIDFEFPEQAWAERWEYLKVHHSATKESHFRTKAGHVFPVEVSVHYIRFENQEFCCEFVKDITARKRHEEALRFIVEGTASVTGSDFFRSLVRYVASALHVRIATVSRVVSTSNHGRLRTIALWNGKEFAEGLEGNVERTACEKVLQGKAVRISSHVREQYPDDSLLHQLEAESYYGTPLTDISGNVIGVLAVVDDEPLKEDSVDDVILRIFASRAGAELERLMATEAMQGTNRRLEETLKELKRTQAQIIQQERLHALGTLASGIAHDFNNALTPIVGFSELLLVSAEHLENKATARNFLSTINTAALDAANVVRRLREFYRSRDTNEIFAAVQLNQVVQQVVLLTQPKWKDQAQERGLTIKIQTSLGEVPFIPGNESELREMLVNMVFNAVDAMPAGGTLTLETACDDSHVVLRVKDTGTGMTDQIRQRCFEPFFSTKGERGTGLGLSMVHGIIRRHGGSIGVESEMGKGTTFSIKLPIQSASERREEITSAERIASQNLHVLVVDDEPMVRDLIIEYLKLDGHTVETAGDGMEGLTKFRAGHFDLVITDRGMPEMNGDQLAASIKKIAPSKPIILLTGFGDIMKTVGDHPIGVDVVVSKPVNRDGLTAAITTAMGNL